MAKLTAQSEKENVVVSLQSEKDNAVVISTDNADTNIPYNRAMEQLILVVQELSLARNLETIMAIVRVAARFLTNADGASFVLRDRDQCFYADEDAIAPLWKGQRFPLKICIGGWTMRNRQPAIIPDVYGDERIPYVAYQPTFVKSMAMVPIRTLDPIGSIGVYWANLHQPTIQEVKLLQALADTTAVAMENVQVYSELEARVRQRTAELEAVNTKLREEVQERQQAEAKVRQLSLTDELTNLHNRRGFFVLAEQQLKVAHRLNSHYCLLFIDLDGLKKINDNLGHEMGDRAIVDAARILQQSCREADIVARLGGDEFVIFATSNLDDAGKICDRLQANVALFNQNSDRPYQVAMSIGVQCCLPQDKVSLETLLAQADELMYTQKRHKKVTHS
ncbi:diguanylate cyclase [Phormidium sp. LEGE 05292]|uniref:GGDEF domain-containing protein n=1 Tax=[Phormidium] sp. LEGE 05292 TaxID=767427 RepID=UPI00188258DE|nr:sensor domain-containing diguanylate cyclase [Phormidium sp. LEGE 05292]MBE9228266.1 diguanylate cyclase [Phormidium sp. LEGE 05292]